MTKLLFEENELDLALTALEEKLEAIPVKWGDVEPETREPGTPPTRPLFARPDFLTEQLAATVAVSMA